MALPAMNQVSDLSASDGRVLAYRCNDGGAPSGDEQTWLILPVVICLSQRLSHACLSISFYTAKLRMAHSSSYSSFDDHSCMDSRGNSRANTCAKTRLEGLCLLVTKPTQAPLGLAVIHNNRTNRIVCIFTGRGCCSNEYISHSKQVLSHWDPLQYYNM